jgi:hypothetical protein
VEYWEQRKRVFGKRWLLPLTLSGEGALDNDDLAVLKSGYVVLLHFSSSADGRFVLYINRCRTPAGDVDSLQRKLRVIFYLMAVAAESESSRHAGFHIVKYLGDDIPEESAYDKDTTRKTMDLILSKCVPIRVRSLHLLCLTNKKETQHISSSNIVSMMLPLLERWKFISMRTIVHFGATREEILKSVEEYGFTKEVLPNQVGGSWSYEKDLMLWWTKAECTKFGNLKVASGAPGRMTSKRVAKAAFDHIEGMTEEEKLRQKKRAMDAIYARRKRERQRIEMEVLQERCAAIKGSNDELSLMNSKLEELLRSAEEVVQRHLSYGQAALPPGNVPVQAVPMPNDAAGAQRVATDFENAILAAASIFGLYQDSTLPLAALASLQMNQPFLAGGAFAPPAATFQGNRSMQSDNNAVPAFNSTNNSSSGNNAGTTTNNNNNVVIPNAANNNMMGVQGVHNNSAGNMGIPSNIGMPNNNMIMPNNNMIMPNNNMVNNLNNMANMNQMNNAMNQNSLNNNSNDANNAVQNLLLSLFQSNSPQPGPTGDNFQQNFR